MKNSMHSKSKCARATISFAAVYNFSRLSSPKISRNGNKFSSSRLSYHDV